MEAALRIREQRADTKITVLTLGPESARNVLRGHPPVLLERHPRADAVEPRAPLLGNALRRVRQLGTVVF